MDAVLSLLLACARDPDRPSPPGAEAPTGHTGPADTGPADTATDPADTATPTGPPWDCAALPAGPLPASPIDTVAPSEDLAFDPLGHVITHSGTFLWRTLAPPAAPEAWVPTAGGPGGPASIRMLSNGDVVYHNVDTSALYRVTPAGGETVLFTGFGYAGGIEIGAGDRIYVVDLAGIHRIDAGTGEALRFLERAPWSGPNGVALSIDERTLYVSARDGLWAVPMGLDGLPEGPPARWAEPPPRVSELLGMGVDACDNVYVVGGGAVLRYASAGATPEVLLSGAGARTNLQWGSGVGGWSDTHLYVIGRDRPSIVALDAGVGARPR